MGKAAKPRVAQDCVSSDMSVVIWDGTTLAADKRAVSAGVVRSVTKIRKVRGCLIGYSGDAAFGEQMMYWFAEGAKMEDFPPSQRDKDDWAGLVVCRKDTGLFKYERTPHPIHFGFQHYAIGSGRDFALAALLLGKTATEAVEVTSLLSADCGNGVDTLTFD